MTARDQILTELRRERTDFLRLLASLRPEDWEKPTQLKGWRVHDVVAHLLANCSGEFDEAFRRALAGDATPVIPGDLNAWNEQQAAARRDWPPARLLDEYERASASVTTMIEHWDADLQTPVRLAEAIPPRPFWLEARILGVHHWVHGQDIRKATDRPGGVTDERMRPVIDSLFDMMPLVFRADQARGVRLSVAFDLSGPGGGQWVAEIADGQCRVRRGRAERTDLTFRGTAWSYYRVGQGLMSPVVALLTLKLVPVGNPLTALRFAGLFRTGKSAVNRPVEAEARSA